MKWRFKIYIFLAAIAVTAILPGTLDILFSRWDARTRWDGLSREALGHYAFFKDHLHEPFTGYTSRQTLLDGFRIVMLSHMACGFANVSILDPSKKAEALELLREIIRRAISADVAPMPRFVERPQVWKKQNLYLSHLNLILGAYRLAGGDREFDSLHQKISQHLSEQSLREPDFHLESFGGGDKWPADQTVTLCSLYVFDQTHGTHLSEKPIQGWLRYMKDHLTDSIFQVHGSYISSDPSARLPRGCALSWSSGYMAQFAPEAARQLFHQYRKHFFQRFLGFGGFREWPPGKNLGMDMDTGPILFGIGAAASGLGVLPARLFADREVYVTLMRTGALLGVPLRWRGKRSYVTAPLLGEAILFNAESATFWFQAPLR